MALLLVELLVVASHPARVALHSEEGEKTGGGGADMSGTARVQYA